MNIYISNLPKGARSAELKKLVKESIRGLVFTGVYDRASNLGRLDNGVKVKIVKNRDQKTRNKRYGLISIDSERLAPVALEGLQSAELRGKSLSVRQYFERSKDNDRRKNSLSYAGPNRRKNDRRFKIKKSLFLSS